MSRFAVEEVEVETAVKKRKEQESQIPSGPTSMSPGRWLTEANITTMGLDPDNEARQTVEAVLESYRFGHRYRKLRKPIVGQGWESDPSPTEFVELGEEIETKSLCYSYADVKAIREESMGQGFSMMGAKGVITSVDRLIHHYPTDRAAELRQDEGLAETVANIEEDGDEDTETQVESYTAPVKYQHIPTAVVEARYHAWFHDPSEAHHRAFWGDLYGLLYKRTMSSKSKDGDRMWAHQRYEEFLNEFTGDFAKTLNDKREAGEEILKFMNYLNRAWKRRFITASIECADFDRFHVRDTFKHGEEYEEPTKFSKADKGAFAEDRIYVRGCLATPSDTVDILQQVETGEEAMERLEGLLATLDPELADLVGYKLAGLTDEEAGQRMGGKSRQSVLRLKAKIKRANKLAKAAA